MRAEKKSSQLKVLQVGPLPPPIGGMATVVKNLLESLRGQCQLKHLNNAKTTAEDRPLWQGVVAQVKLLTRLVWLSVSWRPDVVHIHTCSWFTFWRNSLDVLLVRLLGRKVVLHIHGGRFDQFLSSLSGAKAMMARWIFRLSNQVIVLGEEWKKVLSGWVPEERIKVVPNGVPVPPDYERSWHNPPLITCLASYDKGKGQRDLLKAVARLSPERRVRVALLGDEGELGEKQALEDLAASLGLAGLVEIPGSKTGRDKQMYLDRTDIFCLPSYKEGLPMAMLEAMAEGIPVVATRVGAIPEVVEEGNEGCLFEAGDVGALTSYLSGLLEHPERAKLMGHAGHERLMHDFSLDISVGQLVHVYESFTEAA